MKGGWRVVYAPQAERLLAILARDPSEAPPRCEKLVGLLSGAFSRRINIQYRLVYQVLEDERTVNAFRLFARCE